MGGQGAQASYPFCAPAPPAVCGHIFCRQCVSAQISSGGHGAAGALAALLSFLDSRTCCCTCCHSSEFCFSVSSPPAYAAAEAELAFHCPTCGHALGKYDVHSVQALSVADGGKNGAAAAAAAEAAAAADGGGMQQQQQQQQLQQNGGLGPAGGGGGGGGGGARGGGGEGAEAGQLQQQECEPGSSAKLDVLMSMLRELRDKGAAGDWNIHWCDFSTANMDRMHCTL